MAALGLTGAGVTSYLVQRERVDRRIDTHLAQEVEELRTFAENGVDPETGEPFATVDRLLLLALQRNVPDATEGLLTMLDGELYLVPAANVDLRLEDDPAFIEQARATATEQNLRARTVQTEMGSLRYVTVPVHVEGDSAEGIYVIAYSRDLEQASLTDSYRTFAVVGVVSLVVIGVVGWAVAGRLLRPVRLLRETAQRISDQDLSGRIPVRGRDDVSELARTVNAMLDRLEGAFAAHRQALDDAGHELRTPITIIRGHLELMEAADPADVDEVRALALDELDRMRRLVDDLVVLAQAQRPDFVRRRPVDLDRMLDDVLDKARALADRRWTISARAHAVADVDEQRLTQALLQLVSNAVRFTGDDDEIALGAYGDAARTVLWVRDAGTGIPPADLERIFERFHRVSGQRGDTGSGLGLAIVQAIAEAHHGTVEVSSTYGEGSEFRIVLPATSSVASPGPRKEAEATS